MQDNIIIDRAIENEKPLFESKRRVIWSCTILFIAYLCIMEKYVKNADKKNAEDGKKAF